MPYALCTKLVHAYSLKLLAPFPIIQHKNYVPVIHLLFLASSVRRGAEGSRLLFAWTAPRTLRVYCIFSTQTSISSLVTQRESAVSVRGVSIYLLGGETKDNLMYLCERGVNVTRGRFEVSLRIVHL